MLDPQTGAVLAMASSPDYDPNQYGTIRDESLRAQVEADVPVSYTHLDVYKRQGLGDPVGDQSVVQVSQHQPDAPGGQGLWVQGGKTGVDPPGNG